MSLERVGFGVASAAMAAVMCGSALAQVQRDGPETFRGAIEQKAEEKAREAGGEKITSEAKELLARVGRAYANLETYRSVITLETKAEIDGEGQLPPGMTESTTAKLSFERPTRVRMETDDFVINSDGETLSTYMSAFGQYVSKAAPAAMTLSDIAGNEFMQLDKSLPQMALLFSHGQPVEKVLGLRGEIRASEVTRDGKTYPVLTGEFPGFEIAPGMTTDNMPVELVVDPETSLINSVSVDLTSLFMSQFTAMGVTPEQIGLPRVKSFRAVTSASGIEVNRPIAKETFVFTAPEGAKSVEEFDPMAAMMEQMEGMEEGMPEPPAMKGLAVGDSAPSIESTYTDGKAFKLSDMKGKVVVLDFWATWCGPCLRVMPQLEEVHRHYKDQPVVILGVNQDRGMSGAQVAEFVQKKDWTFPHIMDPGFAISKAYSVSGYPTKVIVDQDGKIADVTVGAGPNAKDELIQKIEKLLAKKRG